MLADVQIEKLISFQRSGVSVEEAYSVLGHEYKPSPTGPQPNQTKMYKAPPLQRATLIGPLTDQEAKKKYAEVISAQLLMQILDPMLKDFNFDKLSEVEKVKYLEEARRIEEEQFLVATILGACLVRLNKPSASFILLYYFDYLY